MMKKLFLLSATAWLLASCNSSDTKVAGTSTETHSDSAMHADLSSVRKSIEEHNAAFAQMVLKGDSAGIAAGYSSDGMLLPPNMPAVSAKDMAGFWGGAIRMGMKNVKLTTTEVYGDNNTATEVGTWDMMNDKGESVEKGKFIVIWKNEGGNWKMYRDIWNSDMMPPAAK